MTAFQIVAVVLTSGLAAVTAAAALRRRPWRWGLLPWAALWVVAAAAIARPEATTALAQLVGIGRGADVVLYCAVLGGIVVAFRLTQAQRRLQRELTLLVRALAIAQGERPVGPIAGSSLPQAGEGEAPSTPAPPRG